MKPTAELDRRVVQLLRSLVLHDEQGNVGSAFAHDVAAVSGFIRDEIGRLTTEPASQDALPPLMLWTWPRDEHGCIIAREDERRRGLRGVGWGRARYER